MPNFKLEIYLMNMNEHDCIAKVKAKKDEYQRMIK